jgi:hypothetical protein
LLDLHKCWKELGVIRVSNVSDLLVGVYLSLLDGQQLPLYLEVIQIISEFEDLLLHLMHLALDVLAAEEPEDLVHLDVLIDLVDKVNHFLRHGMHHSLVLCV